MQFILKDFGELSQYLILGNKGTETVVKNLQKSPGWEEGLSSWLLIPIFKASTTMFIFPNRSNLWKYVLMKKIRKVSNHFIIISLEIKIFSSLLSKCMSNYQREIKISTVTLIRTGLSVLGYFSTETSAHVLWCTHQHFPHIVRSECFKVFTK